MRGQRQVSRDAHSLACRCGGVYRNRARAALWRRDPEGSGQDSRGVGWMVLGTGKPGRGGCDVVVLGD